MGSINHGQSTSGEPDHTAPNGHPFPEQTLFSQSEGMHSFCSPSGSGIPSVTAAQMLEVDRVAVEETGPTLFEMMENAGRALAQVAIDSLPDRWKEAQILILAGVGGNGGGGITAGRFLLEAGANPLLCLTSPEKVSGVPMQKLTQYREAGGQEVSVEEAPSLRPALIIDAMVGYSLQGALRGDIADLAIAANRTDATIVSLDIPSGLDSTTGRPTGVYVSPDKTLTLALPKTGLTPALCGELFLADLGIVAETYQRAGIEYSSPFAGEAVIPLHLS